ncbi:MAG: DUF4214 domain-containing protein [Lachnospiraceae bacterium]|nr:DUF4214 domain-containing protein [Lachnospiraceae bacterium]
MKKLLSLLLAVVLVMGLMTSSAFAETTTYSKDTKGFVTRMYKVVLDRDPDEKGLNDWVTSLNNGTKSAADIVLGFFLSKEYTNKNKSVSAVVTDFYRAMLDREPDTEGKKYWVQRLTVGMTVKTICRGFVGSAEFKKLCKKYGINTGTVVLDDPRDTNYERTYFVYRLYKNCLGRNPDADGILYWCQKLDAGMTGVKCAQGFVFSKEYYKKHSTNRAFIGMMYATILGRKGDSAGIADWEGQLNYTQTREHVFNGFVKSKEFGEQCQRAGITVGDRIEEDDNTAAWQMNVEILRLVNELREESGLTKLITREDLWENVAMVRAKELIKLFSNTRPDNTSCFTLYSSAGVKNALAENIAKDYNQASIVVAKWNYTTTYRNNLLDPAARTMATGFVMDKSGNCYYAQEFTSSK